MEYLQWATRRSTTGAEGHRIVRPHFPRRLARPAHPCRVAPNSAARARVLPATSCKVGGVERGGGTQTLKVKNIHNTIRDGRRSGGMGRGDLDRQAYRISFFFIERAKSAAGNAVRRNVSARVAAASWAFVKLPSFARYLPGFLYLRML